MSTENHKPTRDDLCIHNTLCTCVGVTCTLSTAGFRGFRTTANHTSLSVGSEHWLTKKLYWSQFSLSECPLCFCGCLLVCLSLEFSPCLSVCLSVCVFFLFPFSYRQRQRQRQTDRQTYRQTDRQTDKQADRDREREQWSHTVCYTTFPPIISASQAQRRRTPTMPRSQRGTLTFPRLMPSIIAVTLTMTLILMATPTVHGTTSDQGPPNINDVIALLGSLTEETCRVLTEIQPFCTGSFPELEGSNSTVGGH